MVLGGTGDDVGQPRVLQRERWSGQKRKAGTVAGDAPDEGRNEVAAEPLVLMG